MPYHGLPNIDSLHTPFPESSLHIRFLSCASCHGTRAKPGVKPSSTLNVGYICSPVASEKDSLLSRSGVFFQLPAARRRRQVILEPLGGRRFIINACWSAVILSFINSRCRICVRAECIRMDPYIVVCKKDQTIANYLQLKRRSYFPALRKDSASQGGSNRIEQRLPHRSWGHSRQ